MRVISPFGSSLEDIANHGCSAIASRFVNKLFEAKIAKAVERVTSAKSRLSRLETELALSDREAQGQIFYRGFSEELSDKEVKDLKLAIELAEYEVASAMEQHDAVLEEKDRCYWKVAYDKEYF